jgi:hypothetical protein
MANIVARFLAARTRKRNTLGHAAPPVSPETADGHDGGTADRRREKERAMDDISDALTHMDDSALLSMRAEMRTELERLPPASPDHAALAALYDKTTEEVDDRARRA